MLKAYQYDTKSVFIYFDKIKVVYVYSFRHNYCSYIYIARILILRDGRELKLKHKIILISCLALVSSFLFAGGGIQKKYLLETEEGYDLSQLSLDLSSNSELGFSYNHISNASLGDKNPGANSYMFNFLKKF